jgi:hypothetical protein
MAQTAILANAQTATGFAQLGMADRLASPGLQTIGRLQVDSRHFAVLRHGFAGMGIKGMCSRGQTQTG